MSDAPPACCVAPRRALLAASDATLLRRYVTGRGTKRSRPQWEGFSRTFRLPLQRPCDGGSSSARGSDASTKDNLMFSSARTTRGGSGPDRVDQDALGSACVHTSTVAAAPTTPCPALLHTVPRPVVHIYRIEQRAHAGCDVTHLTPYVKHWHRCHDFDCYVEHERVTGERRPHRTLHTQQDAR